MRNSSLSSGAMPVRWWLWRLWSFPFPLLSLSSAYLPCTMSMKPMCNWVILVFSLGLLLVCFPSIIPVVPRWRITGSFVWLVSLRPRQQLGYIADGFQD